MTRDYEFMHDIDMMREWIDFGDKEDNPFMRFMAYWLVFNMVYEPFKEARDEDGHIKRDEKGRRIQLKDFEAIWTCMKKNDGCFKHYDPFACGDADALKDTQLYARGRNRAREARLSDDDRKDVYALMWAVYKFRCRFFHGNKTLGDPNDRNLASSSANIVRGYLSTLGFPSTRDR